MNRETALAAAAVGLVAVALLAAAAVPGALADPTDDRFTSPGHVGVVEVAIDRTPVEVTGETATLTVRTDLSHRGNPTENVSLRVRAVDAESGLVATTRTVDVGTLRDDGEVTVPANVTVPREGGYRIETTVYRGDERVDEAAREVRGLEALTPPYARTPVRFTESETLPAVSFSVADAGQNRTTLALDASLTNRGDAQSADLSVSFVLRQADSNIVAARETVPVDAVRPGRTAAVSTDVTVPSEYNYYVDVVLWKDGVVVDTARSAANLNPTETIDVNQTRTEVELRVSDFETEKRTRAPAAEGTDTTSADQPGFGPGVAAAALLAVGLLARRWSG